MVGMISGWLEWSVGDQQEEKLVKGWGRASRGSRRRGREKTFCLHRICIAIARAARPRESWPECRRNELRDGQLRRKCTR